jgi:hypothetical protein
MTSPRENGRRQPVLVPVTLAIVRVDGMLLNNNCDAAGSSSVTHHFIVKPVQNLP